MRIPNLTCSFSESQAKNGNLVLGQELQNPQESKSFCCLGTKVRQMFVDVFPDVMGF